jgi:membrane associated rhomboid family serine protease
MDSIASNRLPALECDNSGMTTQDSPAEDAEFNPLADILRLCAAAAPAPWYPRQYAKAAGISLSELSVDVEFLWQEGFLSPVNRPNDPVPGLVLTPAGARILADPAELAALNDGREAPRARDSAARRALREARTPVVSRWLLVVNVIVFTFGFFIASGRGAGGAYLSGHDSPVTLDVLHRIGSVSADDLVAGRWWRLLTAAFVHGFLLHLLMNMSMLAFGFGLVESMWSRPRFLLIYLIAAIGGNCVAMAWRPLTRIAVPNGFVEVTYPVVGASGALCGILGAVVVWLAFNARYIPRGAVIQLRNSLIASGVLLVFISLFPRVSGLCHLGGALFGAAAAILLHIERWNRGPWRLAAMAGLVALPWLGVQMIDRARATDPRWSKVERQVFDQLFKQRVTDALDEAGTAYAFRISPLLRKTPDKRDEEQKNRALAIADKITPMLQELSNDLAKAGPYHDTDAEKDREADLERIQKLSDKFAEAVDVLQRNANSAEKNDAEEATFSRQFLNRMRGTMRRTIAIYQSSVQPLLKASPRERQPETVEKVLLAVESLKGELANLTEALGDAGPYGNAQVEHARLTAERYTAARTTLLDAAARCLRLGEKWTPDEEAALQKHAEKVGALRKEWEELVERD